MKWTRRSPNPSLIGLPEPRSSELSLGHASEGPPRGSQKSPSAALSLFRLLGRELHQPAKRQVFRAPAECDLVAIQLAYVDKDGGCVIERHLHLEGNEVAFDDSPVDRGFSGSLDDHGACYLALFRVQRNRKSLISSRSRSDDIGIPLSVKGAIRHREGSESEHRYNQQATRECLQPISP